MLNNPYVVILKLKGSIVDVSVIAINCAVLGMWDYRAVIAIIAGIMIHSGCDIIKITRMKEFRITQKKKRKKDDLKEGREG